MDHQLRYRFPNTPDEKRKERAGDPLPSRLTRDVFQGPPRLEGPGWQ